jgi:hypothetical protein
MEKEKIGTKATGSDVISMLLKETILLVRLHAVMGEGELELLKSDFE